MALPYPESLQDADSLGSWLGQLDTTQLNQFLTLLYLHVPPESIWERSADFDKLLTLSLGVGLGCEPRSVTFTSLITPVE